MKRKQFSEEQIIKVLAEGEAGATGKEVCRRHGISEQTFYRWKSKYGGMTVSEAKRLRELEAENRKLKQLLGEAHLDNAALKELLSKKLVRPAAKREAVQHLVDRGPAQSAAGRQSGWYASICSAVSIVSGDGQHVEREAEGIGDPVPTLWLRDIAWAAEAGRPGHQRETNVSDLPRRAPSGSTEEAEAIDTTATCSDADGDASQSAMVDGFRERSASDRPPVSNLQPGGRFHQGMCRADRGLFDLR